MTDVQENMARLRALREARDGTPEQQAEAKRKADYAKTLRSMQRSMRKMTRLAGQLDKLNRGRYY